MSIFSSIAKGVKSVASKVYSGINTVGNAITSAIGLGSSTANTASALQGTYTGAPLNSGTAGYANTSGGVGVNTYGPAAPKSTTTSSAVYGPSPLPVYGPATPTSFSSGSSTTNTSSPSFSTNLTSGQSNLSLQSPVSTTVSANTIGAGNNTNLISSSPSSKNYTGQVLENNISNGADVSTGLFLPKISATTGQNTSGATNPDGTPKKNALEQYLETLKPAATQADSYIRARNESGLLQAEQQKNNTQNQINGITAKLNQDLLQLRATASANGVTEAVYGGQQAQVSREATIRLLPLQAQLASDQNNLELAQSHLDTLFKIYSTDAQNSVDYYNQQAKAMYEYATASEKRQFDEIAKQKDFQLSLVKSENDTHQSEMAQALKDGNTRLYKALSSVVPPTNINSPTYAQDYQKYLNDRTEAVTKYGGLSTSAQYNQQQLINAQLQGQKLQQEIDSNKPVTGDFAPVINTVSNIVGPTNAPAYRKTISTALASGDFATAYANIANAIEDSLKGTSKTKYADTRTDIGVMTGMRNAISQFVQAGGDMGYLKGSADKIAKNFGQLATDPKFAALGVQLQREFQSYRNNMTGAAFSPAESREYASVNPRTNASLDLNLATIDGALAQLTNRVTSTINQRIPDAQKIYELANPSSNPSSGSLPSGITYKVISN